MGKTDRRYPRNGGVFGPGAFLCGPAATFLWLCVALAVPALAQAPLPSSAGGPPRKVIVATVVQGFYGNYPGLDKRLVQLADIIDGMARQSNGKYGRPMDLAVLPETAVTEGTGTQGPQGAVPFEGAVRDTFARLARRHHCYIVVPMILAEDPAKHRSSNVAILVDRQGNLAGIYRKVHIAVHTGSDSLEDGITPGKDVPVFQCDFGKLGIQICYDMQFDFGWNELERKGAELVAWPSASPQTALPAFRATQHRYYVVSSTPRDSACIFEPTGKITAQVRTPEHILVEELDLSYAILPWSPQLQDGKMLRAKYGDKVGFRYYREEDKGIFWSNDPHLTIGEMIRATGLAEAEAELSRIRKLYHDAGVPAY